MKYADVAGMSDKDLRNKTKELREQMFESRMKNALGQLTNPMTIREMRRDIARLQTALTAKTAGQAPKAAAAPAAPAKKATASKSPRAAAKKAASKAKTTKSAKG